MPTAFVLMVTFADAAVSHLSLHQTQSGAEGRLARYCWEQWYKTESEEGPPEDATQRIAGYFSSLLNEESYTLDAMPIED